MNFNLLLKNFTFENGGSAIVCLLFSHKTSFVYTLDFNIIFNGFQVFWQLKNNS